jgi:translation initiation factor 2 alpha subunit (eIF-2alpha)
VIGVNRRKKQIDLSVRQLEDETHKVEESQEEEEALPTAMELALRRAMEDSGMELPERVSKTKKREKKGKRRTEREDIFARTLQQHAKE